MSVELYAKASTAEPQHFHLPSRTAIIMFELCGAPFHPEVGETTAQMASHYAEVMRRQLSEGEFERVFKRETGDDPTPDNREQVEEFAQFCLRSGGYTMWV